MSKTKRSSSLHHKKRHGKHHNHSQKYRKAYWPYLPMLVLLFSILTFNSFNPLQQIGSVLGTSRSISSIGLLSRTNDARTKAQVNSLTYSEKLQQAAQQKAQDMAQRDYWSHTSPDGQQVWSLLGEVDYTYQSAGENLAYGFTTDNGTVAGWLNSQSHRENLLSSKYSEVGFGIAHSEEFQGKKDQTIVVALYGKQKSDAATLAVTEQVPTQSLQTFGFSNIPNSNWILPSATLVVGLLAGFLIARHSLRFVRVVRRGEHFVMHHPKLDIGLTLVIVLAVSVVRSSGVVG